MNPTYKLCSNYSITDHGINLTKLHLEEKEEDIPVFDFYTDLQPQQFDEIASSIPKYTLLHGGIKGIHALDAASLRGNIQLIEHIVKKGGKELINLGSKENNSFPLYSACMNLINSKSKSDEKCYLTAKKLIELGAEVNLLDPWGGFTVLYYAAEITNNFALIKLFCEHGGIAYPTLSASGQAIVDQAREEIKNGRHFAEIVTTVAKSKFEKST